MIKSYLKIAWRNLLKRKVLSVINILGLSIGIAACMIIYIYVQHELGYDRYNLKSDRITRVATRVHAPESDLVLANAPIPLADALRRGFPEVESAVRLEAAPLTFKVANEYLREEDFYKSDTTIFSIFDFDFLEGSKTNALTEPNTVIITKSVAIKYFGRSPALGKTMMTNGLPLLVTGVVKDRPANSDLFIKGLLSTNFSKTTAWMDDWVYTYVLFKSKPNLQNFTRKINQFSSKYVQPELDKMGDKEYHVEFESELLSEVHFSQGKLADTPKGNKQTIYIFSLLAVFILIIALLNYINLSTAKSVERAREVGIRKVSGAKPIQLIRQFLFESLLLISISYLAGCAFVALGLSFFNKLLDTELTVNWVQVTIFTMVVFLSTLILAGLYPAFVLSSFQPVKVLKGSWRNTGRGVWLRKTVSVTQFVIAAGLIMGTTVIYNQMKFIEEKDLGFSKEQLLNLNMPRDSGSAISVNAFRNDLLQRPEITGLTIGSGMTEDGLTIGPAITEAEGKKRDMMCNYYAIDPEFLNVFKIDLLEGRNLSDSFSTDKMEGFLVNEAFVKEMGWKSGLGKKISAWGKNGQVVGVVKNFYYKSLHNVVEPLVLVYDTYPINTITVKIKPVHLPVVKELFRSRFPSIAIDYEFFDEMVNNQYQKDRITSILFTGFTMLAIFVSCLGLYGLVALITVQRTKEIGIRKVLGATMTGLLKLMTKDFMQLLIAALIIALPLSGYIMNKWLGTYAYHIPLSWWMFLIPVFFLVVISLLVISKEIIKTALINPIKSLKTE
ncbi:ABC transporter permease [Flavitalea sp.]|nr:ABC transporter permease [Flavitalea sp.]